jgi:hypothetical protein
VTPHRVIGLILASCRLGGGVTVNTVFAPVLRLAFGADRLSRIRGARLVTIERGGHQFLGHDAEVCEEINAFVASAGPKSP